MLTQLLTPRTRTLPLVATLLTLALAPASLRGQDVPMPESAVTTETAVAVWIDAEQFNTESLRAAAETVNAALPQQMQTQKDQLQAKLDESMGKFESGYKAFTDHGGEGVLMLMQVPAQGMPSEPATLMRVAPDADLDAMQAAMEQIEGAKQTDLAEYQPGWATAKQQLSNVPTDGTADQAQAFQALMTNTEGAPIRIAFRMTDVLKDKLAQQQNPGGQGRGGGMGAMGPAQSLIGPAQSINAGWATVTFGEDPAFSQTIRFDDDQSAQQFAAAWDGLLMMGQGMLQSQLGRGPNAPKPETIQGLFNQLKLQPEGNTLTNRLGTPFIQRVGELAPAAQGLMMMMMGGPGGMGPGGQPGQQPQGPPQQR